MPDVFISYKKEDLARVEPIARGLAAAGYEVWWDHRIPPGRTYRDVIGAALSEAKCVLVVWSTLAAQAQWVLDEADEGKKRGVLLPVLIDDVDIPYGFRQIEAARLVGWTGDARHPEWVGVLDSVSHFVKRSPGGPAKTLPPIAKPSAAPAPEPTAAKSGIPLGPVLGAVAAVALLGGGYMSWQSGLIGGAAPALEDATASDLNAPAETQENPQAATPAAYLRKPVIVPSDEFGTFGQSGYTYCDAVLLTQVWTKDIGENKMLIGRKLINDNQVYVETSLANARATGARCTWNDLGYEPADAEKLAAAWGNTAREAQVKAAEYYMAGEGSEVERLLGR
jgi:hypothetical protein